MWRRSASGARINDLHAYLCAFRSKPPVSANRVTQTRSPSSPSLESGYPKSALKISSRASAERSRAEPSRALASRRLRIFFFSLHIPPPIFPRCPEWRIHPFRWHTRAYTVSISVYIYIYARARPADRLALSLFSRGRAGGGGYRQKRDQTDDGDKKRKNLSPSLVDESGRFAQR